LQRRVLDGVVQDRGDKVSTSMPISASTGHRDRMGDVGLAALAGLAVVRRRGQWSR
jgi:MYXO-CTERM domain-containing protein